MDKNYDSVLVGWTDEPKRNDNGDIVAWTVKLKDHELQDMIDKYTTTKNEKGGGNVYLTLFMSKSGKACARVFDPNSEGAKERRNAKAEASTVGTDDDLPF
jgi:hypothetical protein|tara:strand:+ start:479 stop:781 length:303 start_codon:yes stop_codon:yes gene_type:complete